MGQRRKSGPRVESAAELEMRDQEVLRANRELAAYFKGLRTEREARAALKIIKAFVRGRERQEAGSRRPLPGLTTKETGKGDHRKRARPGGVRVARSARKSSRLPESEPAAVEAPAEGEP